MRVFEPDDLWYWQAAVRAVVVVYGLVVLPFELGFRQQLPLATHVCAHLTLSLDVLVGFNTAYFDGAWVRDRHKIARRYARGWLAVDVLSVVLVWPKLVRLRWNFVARYLVALLAAVHVFACVMAYVDSRISSGDVFVVEHAALRFGHSGTTLWAEYVLCLHFAVGCVTGSTVYYNLTEAVAALAMQFAILVIVASFVSEILVKRQDSLTDSLDVNGTEKALLTNYARAARDADRTASNLRLISQLSPPMRSTLSNWYFAKQRVVLLTYCRRRAVNLVPGRVVRVRPNPTEDARTWRVVRVNDRDDSYLLRRVRRDPEGRYRDDAGDRYQDTSGLLELLTLSQLPDHELLSPWQRLAASKTDHECRSFVAALASRLETHVYLTKQVLVRRNTSLNDTLFLVAKGTVVLVGRTRPLAVELVGAHDSFGEDIAMRATQYCHSRTRTFSATAKGTSLVHSLDAPTFVDLVNQHPTLRVGVYGTWLVVKYAMVERHSWPLLCDESKQSPHRSKIETMISPNVGEYPCYTGAYERPPHPYAVMPTGVLVEQKIPQDHILIP